MLDPFAKNAVRVDHLVGEGGNAPERRWPSWFEIEQILDQCRHSVERSKWIVGEHLPVGSSGRCSGVVVSLVDHRVEVWVADLDAVDRSIDQFG